MQLPLGCGVAPPLRVMRLPPVPHDCALPVRKGLLRLCSGLSAKMQRFMLYARAESRAVVAWWSEHGLRRAQRGPRALFLGCLKCLILGLGPLAEHHRDITDTSAPLSPKRGRIAEVQSSKTAPGLPHLVWHIIPRETPIPAQSVPGAPDLGYASQRIFMHHHNM